MVRTVAQAVGRQPLNEHARARPQANTLRSTKCHWGRLSPSTSAFSCQ